MIQFSLNMYLLIYLHLFPSIVGDLHTFREEKALFENFHSSLDELLFFCETWDKSSLSQVKVGILEFTQYE